MIQTSTQLKALVRNMSKSNSTEAQTIIRNYVMERFLERLSCSPYRENFILKGGMLVSAMVGLDTRSTLDIDTTLRNLPLTVDDMHDILSEILSVSIDDGMKFQVLRITEIMDEAEYPGIRVSLDATLDTMHTPLKLDISTGDAITPREISYAFKLMFEERVIHVLAYNLETVLSEKLETILSRSTANTRLRDFYDVYILQQDAMQAIDAAQFKAAFTATCNKRGSGIVAMDGSNIINEISDSEAMQLLWKRYQKKYAYADDISWTAVMRALRNLYQATLATE